jgi:hypothetical protein
MAFHAEEGRIWRKSLEILLKTSTSEAQGLPHWRPGEKRDDIEADDPDKDRVRANCVEFFT